MSGRLRIHPLCRVCGYDLSGLALGQKVGTCPECGAGFDPSRPWLWPPWPKRWRIVVRLFVPLMLAMAIVLVAKRGFAGGGGMLVGGVAVAFGMRLVLFVLAFVVVVAGAIVVITGLTDRHLPMPRGAWIKGGLILLSLVINLGGLLIMLVVL